MGRFIAPLLAFAAAFWIWNTNRRDDGEYAFLFPLNNIFDDPAEAGQRSWQLLVLVGVVWLASDIRAVLARRRARPKQDE